MRRQAVRDLAAVLLTISLLVIPVLPSLFGRVTAETAGLVFGLIGLAGTTLLIGDRHPAAGARLLVAGFAALLGLASTFLPAVILFPWFTLVVLIAGFLMGPLTAAGFAALGSIALIAWHSALNVDLSLAGRLSIGLLLWSATGLSWLALRPLLIALGWSWQNYLGVRAANVALKERQGELNQTVKSLNDVLYRLDQANLELERARHAANQARQLKSEFAVNVSHELRTPLNLIIGFSEMMVTAPQTYDGQVLPPAYHEDAVAIYRNARHLSDLVDDILDLSQIEAGRMALQREMVSLERSISEAIETVRVLYEQKGLTLLLDVPPDLPPVFADRTRLRQIIINLLANAVRFTDRGGATVRVALDNRDVQIAVVDTGRGIALEDLPRVFNEFWQGIDSQHLQGGSGVGLAVSKRFVEMHGGAMTVESVFGQGTTFTFTIPRSAALPEMLPPRPWETWARASASAERPSLAVVTEEEDVIRLFQRYFDTHTVIPLSDVSALSVLPAKGNLAGIVIVAPDGQAAHHRALVAQTHLRTTPVIACGLVSGRRSLAERLGVADYLVKPVNRIRLSQILQRLPRRGRRLLVVDDDPDAARLMVRMLRAESRQLRVATASGGAEALRFLADEIPDAIFLDLVMPEINGYNLIETIHHDSRLSETPIVAVSAKGVNLRPLSSDGVIFLQPEGMAISHLIDCIRHGLEVLTVSSISDASSDAPSASMENVNGTPWVIGRTEGMD